MAKIFFNNSNQQLNEGNISELKNAVIAVTALNDDLKKKEGYFSQNMYFYLVEEVSPGVTMYAIFSTEKSYSGPTLKALKKWVSTNLR